MRFLRIGNTGNEKPILLHEGHHFDLSFMMRDIDPSFITEGGVEAIRQAHSRGKLPPIDITRERVGPPIPRPGKIVCVGLNYRDHAEETGADLPQEPVIFMKDPSTVIGPFDNVHIPRGSTKTDWEVELGVVIGRTARYLDSPTASQAHIAGYVISHDVSEREFQLERGGQWDKGKSCETFNPLGPWLVSADEISFPQSLGMKLTVNGIQRQNGTTKNMIFDVNHIIWYLSQFMVLHAGDLINTGTPAGVALGLPDKPYLRAGDIVELNIQGLGHAQQNFVQA